jgi:hypothetical protein
MVNWLKQKRDPLAAFVLSLACGIVVPLATLPAEYWVRGEIDGVSWFAAGVTYVAGIGLVWNYKPGLIFMLLAAMALTFFYGVNMKGVFDWAHEHPGTTAPPFSVLSAQILIASAAVVYFVDRVGRHLINYQPFPG